ncbi:hypothetical protein UFOVP1437_63 [uncultured Caudovirales phage]|uniref:Uncharacterized protein n=1 Tax=uncultured Caudovirales phage TaxID=2100421 RepID=A0A6J5SGB7_9CAUD|nr:hypothetical protein UFOVP1437_63 [uncultured Caudovirales phage]CAB5228108.1 hypothetical protein UFOVP1531_2 [uncultured Caudovirales phage]
MARPKILAIVPVAASATDICLSQTRASAGVLTLNGAKAGTTFDFARKLDLVSGGNLSAITFTCVGTDADGRALSDAVTGPNANTVQSTKYFQTVTSITASANMSAVNITVGTSDDLATKKYLLNFYDEIAAVVAVHLTAGTATFSVQETYSQPDGVNDTEVWVTPTALSAKTATLVASLDAHAKACRLITTAFSAPTLSFNITQSGC